MKTRYGEDAEIDWSLGNSPPTRSTSTTKTTANKTSPVPALTAAPTTTNEVKAVTQVLEAAGETPSAATAKEGEAEEKPLEKGDDSAAGKSKAVDRKQGDEFEPDAEEEEALEEMMRSQE